MSNTENNWQFSKKVGDESKLRVFIKNYQSSPLELVVSALNEKLKSVKAKDGDPKNGAATQKDKVSAAGSAKGT